jgi:hypothetical protein
LPPWLANLALGWGLRIQPRWVSHLPISHDPPISAFESIAQDDPAFRIDPVLQPAVHDAA